jgi:protease-4
LIQRELILARKEKPVVISMGHLAASGGYWIATYGDRIFAEPNTITGSIGVYGLLPNIQKLANEHGITWDGIQTAKLSGMTTMTRPKSIVELAKIQELVDDVYDQFLDRVSVSRGISKSRVNDIAQGRVWSGRQALNIGLVDELGGMRDAINCAAKLAKIDGDYKISTIDGDYKISTFAEPKTLLESIICGDEGHALSESRSGLLGELYSRFDSIVGNIQALNDPRGIYVRILFDTYFR